MVSVAVWSCRFNKLPTSQWFSFHTKETGFFLIKKKTQQSVRHRVKVTVNLVAAAGARSGRCRSAKDAPVTWAGAPTPVRAAGACRSRRPTPRDGRSASWSAGAPGGAGPRASLRRHHPHPPRPLHRALSQSLEKYYTCHRSAAACPP